MIKKIPKLRGHGTNRAKTVNEERVRALVVNLADIEKAFDAGADVNPKTLAAAGLVDMRSGKVQPVKILGNGALTKKLSVSGCTVSGSAREKIEAAGGSIA